MRKKTLMFALVSLLALLAGEAVAQVVTGSIGGTVKDSSGAVIPNATVTITNTDKNIVVRTVKTNSSGQYAAPLIPVGHYAVSAEANGFKQMTQTGVNLDVNQGLTVNFTMEIGEVQQSVKVEAAPLQVDLQNAQAQTVITGTQIRELAVNTRNYEQLVTLMPGVSTGLPSDQLYVGVSNPVGTSNQINFSINGGRPTQNEWNIDGADNVDRGANLTLLAYPSIDSIDEFSVQRGQYAAEYGRSSAGQINVITKSGTSTFHGDLYEFFRSDVLDANNFIFNRGGVQRPPLRYNDFGGTVGGPVFIPGVYNTHKNKTFFFFSEEARRVITYTAFDAQVPTPAMLQGTFVTPVCLNAACTSTGNTVASIDPAAQAYLNDIFKKLPVPAPADCTVNTSTDFCDLITPGRNIFNLHQEIVRIDQVFNPSFSMFGKFENDSIPTQEPGGLFTGSPLPGVSNTTTNSPGRTLSIHATNVFSPMLINDGGYAYSHGGVISNPTGLEGTAQSPDINRAITLPFTSTLARVPDLSFNNFTGIFGFGPYRDFNDNHNIFDNLTKIIGRHTMKFGFTYNWYQKHENAANGNQGSFSFPFSNPNDPNGSSADIEFANFLEGNVANFTQSSRDFTAIIRQQQFEFYAQDEFHIRPNLTIDFGIRNSTFRQPTDAGGHLTTFDPAAYNPATAQQIDPCTGNLGIQLGTCANPNVAPPTGNPLDGIIVGGGTSPFGNAVVQQRNINLAPRVGIAWDPFKTGKTSIRAGYGIYYDSPAVSWDETAIFNNPPFVNSANIVNTTLDNPAGPSVPNFGPPVLTGIGTNWRQPSTQEWSLDVQREVAPKLLVDVGYYGNKGTHLLGDVDINQPTPGAYVTALAPFGVTAPITTFGATEQLNFIRPFKGYDAMNIFSTQFDSNYHSLQISVQKRFQNNSLLNINYTWSHALTDAQSDFTTPVVTSDPHLDYGPAAFDRRQILNVNYVYYIPFFTSQQGLVGHVLGGWEVSGIISAYTGRPFTSFDFFEDPAGIGVLGFSPATERPDLVGNPQSGAPHTFNQWFNTAAFAEVPSGQIRPGNSPRGAILGPGLQRWDISLFKNTKVNERINVQFRAEAFNVFNHTNFDSLHTSFGFGSFGRVSTVRDPRIMQLGLKLYF